MGSTRTPGKTMMSIGGHPLLYYSVAKVKNSKYIDKVVVATTTNEQDDEIVQWCIKNDILFYRGSEEDVLDRYYQAAKEQHADIVVRVTSDCPFVDPDIVDMVIDKLHESHADYVSNRLNSRTWPHGLDVEAFRFSALEETWCNGKTKPEREHVTPYIMNHPEKFKLVEVPLQENLSEYRLTVDYPEDLEFTRVMIEEYGADKMGWRDIIRILDQNKAIRIINSMYVNTNII
ncbi:MAG: glycosyltransferase family protein [Methanogenium sp.]|nr:glycosyltransferase family protein [Methanogenium sp.]